MTDVSIRSICTHCCRLHSLDLSLCDQVSEDSVISISENCTGLKELNVSETYITDDSLLAIAKNCTGLRLLYTDGCSGLSNDELRHEFNSVSELRAVLLSIYPPLFICLECQMCVFMSVSVLCAGASEGAGACELLHSLSLSHTHTQRRASSAAGV